MALFLYMQTFFGNIKIVLEYLILSMNKTSTQTKYDHGKHSKRFSHILSLYM